MITHTVAGVFTIATSNVMHDEFGDNYPKLVFILKSIKNAVEENAAYFDGIKERVNSWRVKL